MHMNIALMNIYQMSVYQQAAYVTYIHVLFLIGLILLMENHCFHACCLLRDNEWPGIRTDSSTKYTHILSVSLSDGFL